MILNNFSTFLIFNGSKSGIRNFRHAYTCWLVEVYRPSNLPGFQTSLILSCQLKVLPINSSTIEETIS